MPDDRRTMAGVAELLGVKTATIRHYRAVSAPGGRYADHPFPEPSGYLGNVPYWLTDRDDEIRAWAAGRPGQGAGGGRPARVVLPNKDFDALTADLDAPAEAVPELVELFKRPRTVPTEATEKP